jgi:hypothetical protein
MPGAALADRSEQGPVRAQGTAHDPRAEAARRRSADPGSCRQLALNAQPALRVSAPADPSEAEADPHAERVKRVPESIVRRRGAACSDASTSGPGCEEETHIQRKPDGGEVGADLAHRLGAAVAIDIGIAMADDGASLCGQIASRGNALNLERTEGCALCPQPAAS